MKKPIFYALVIVLFLQAPFCLIMAHGAMVTKKYEVDEMYWLIERNEKLTTKEKLGRERELNKKGKELKMKSTIFTIISCAGSICASGLLIKRKRITADTKSST